MSLNDYFAANGAVYLRPVGLPDCFSMPGLPHGCKPPSLPMQHPCNTPQKPRTMAAVSPLHQVAPPQHGVGAYEGNSMAFSSSRTSSFAAALRKLAKQAVDPVSGEKDLTHLSPVSSPALNQGSLTPKRSAPNPQPPPVYMNNHQVSYASSSPPVVTIAPSRPVATHTSESRKVMDLSNASQNTSSGPLTNGHLPDPLGLKMESGKTGPRPAHGEKWEEHTMSGKGSSGSSQVRPHATIAPLPRPDDSLTSSRGFQPYRGTEEARNTLPHHISLFEHHHSTTYPYTPAFLPPHHLSHPAYRFDDPLYLERYSLLRPPVMPFPPQPGMMAPPAAFYPNSRYAADLIAQSLSLSSANNSILNHERLKQEEERRLKEMELDQSRTKDLERQREKEQKEKEHREHKEREQREKEKREREKSHREKEDKSEYNEHKKSNTSHNSHSKRTESPNVKNGPVIHGVQNHASPVTSSCSSAPLNLVVHPSVETHKKEAELWVPWQQPVNHYSKDNQESGAQKIPSYRHDNHRHYHSKDSHQSDKLNLQFNPSVVTEKKHPPAPTHIEGDTKKHPSDTPKKFDSLHHHIAELSSKDHEWRHEKLQKAVTNNYRKNHESKKAKEDRHHLFQSYQRKAANGVLLKNTPFQNEGMHARLLETEKTRLELNGHLKQSPAVVSDRLKVPTFKSSFVQPVDREVCQKAFVESYGGVAPRVTLDLTPVVSKLDKEAKDMLKNGFKLVERDEMFLKNFLVVTKGPPLPLDVNPQKMNFLKLFGLTSRFKRKKMELDMYVKRRKILHEDTDVRSLPSEVEVKEELSPLQEISPNLEILAEKLRSETSPDKMDFYLKIGLTPITLVKKEERERIRKIVEEEKSRRHYRLLAKLNKKASPRRLFIPKSESALKDSLKAKIKEEKAFSIDCLSRKVFNGEDRRKRTSSPSQIFTSKNEQVPYLVSSETSDSLLSSKAAASKTVSAFHTPISHRSSNKPCNKFSWKRGHSLKHEWRFSATESKSDRFSAINGYKSCDASNSFFGSNLVSTGTQVDADFAAKNTDSKDLSSLKNAFNWPGLEAVMEAFYRHQNEQSCEKTVLSERYRQLRQSQEDLKKEADSINKHMAELLKTKRDLDEDHQKHQQSLDHLKKCLQPRR